MARSATYQIRIDEVEKQETFAVLHELGLTPAQAVKMFFAQVRSTHSIPFPIERKPNAKTVKAILDAKHSENVVVCKDTADLFEQLGI